MVTKLSAASNECAIESVTIYKDRAEVIRKIRFLYPETGGINEAPIVIWFNDSQTISL